MGFASRGAALGAGLSAVTGCAARACGAGGVAGRSRAPPARWQRIDAVLAEAEALSPPLARRVERDANGGMAGLRRLAADAMRPLHVARRARRQQHLGRAAAAAAGPDDCAGGD